MAMTLEDVIRRSTGNPAAEIRRHELAQLAVGAPADLAVLRVEQGTFRFDDPRGGCWRARSGCRVR